MKPKVIAIAGATASGKTQMSIDLAKKINGEIISADSRLVYKGFDIATAKPTPEERDGIEHYIIDIVEPEYDYSVAQFYDDAKIAIKKILNKGKIPIIVGGTGLYFRVLLENYDLPRVEADEILRNELENQSKEDLLNELKKLDFISYEKLYNSNKRRIIRALEITKILNVPYSSVCAQKEPEFDVEWLTPKIESREILYQRINSRVDKMLDLGIVDETKYLLKKHGRIKKLVNTIGYKEILTYLDGENSLDEALDKLKQHSRNYAKRQLTWFRRNANLNITI